MTFVRLAATTLIAALTLSACGGKDMCDRSVKDAEDCGITVSDAEYDACKTSIEACDSSDNKILDGYYDCITDGSLGECPSEDSSSTGDLDDFESELTALFACLDELQDLSQPCLEGLSGGSSTFSSTFSSTTTTTTTTTTTN